MFALEERFVSKTLELSSVLSGFSPLLQISHRVVPKPHLSVARLRFWGFSMHSGGTQGIRSTRTERERNAHGHTFTRSKDGGRSLLSLSWGSTPTLMPGSLSLMKGRLPVVRSSSRIRRTFLAQTFP